MAILSSSLINYENIYSQSHANLFNLINNRSNIPDPANLSGSRKFIYVREPKIDSRNFEGFPLIIVPSFSISQKENSADMTRAGMVYDIVVRVWTQDNSSDSSGNPNGAEQLNTISDDIIQTINANRKTLINQGLMNFEMSSSDFDYDEIDGKVVYIREFIFTFISRLRVAA